MWWTYWGVCGEKLQSKHNQTALGRQGMSGAQVLLKCFQSVWTIFFFFLHIVLEHVFFTQSLLFQDTSILCLWFRCIFKSYKIISMLSQGPPGAFPDGLKNSYLSLQWHRCQPCARLQGTQEWGLGTSFSPRTKSNFSRSSQCSWTSCTWNKLSLYIKKIAICKS